MSKEEFQNESSNMIAGIKKVVFEGDKHFFHCKYCSVKYYVLYDSSETSEKYFISGNHSKESHESQDNDIPLSTKEAIKDIFFSVLTKPL